MKQLKEDVLISERMWPAWSMHNDDINHFELNGYKYMPEVDRERDPDTGRTEVAKIDHIVIAPDGKRLEVDFTPYHYMNKEDLMLWLKAGMPKRTGTGPLDSMELKKLGNMGGGGAPKQEDNEDMSMNDRHNKHVGRKRHDSVEGAAMMLKGISKK